MLAPSTPRAQIFPLLLIASAITLFVISPAIMGCLIQQPTVLAAEPQQAQPQRDEKEIRPTPAATRAAEAIRLVSPNGKFYIRLEATDTGARIVLAEGDRKIDLHLTEATGNLFIRSGDCTYAATSSKSYSASTVGHAATGRLTTAYCSSPNGKAVESAVACYVLTEHNASANAALYADDNGVGKLQLMRGANHVTVDCPEYDEEQPAGGLFRNDPRETRVPERHSDKVHDDPKASASRVVIKSP